ncbi:MAG: rhomboid family intramembrane serine protease [Candidatus Lokiarchaeota archaeon]|nr:rhomboid family intramembrane serine protease [Candidatus Lokiarchaeota archaeon]
MYSLDQDKIRNARITQVLIIINVVCFIAFNPIYSEKLWLVLAQYNAAVWDGQIWRLITSVFLHGNIEHIFYNMIGLLLFGATVEGFMNKKEYIATFLLSGLVGSIFSLLLESPETLSVGASGAIYGLMGASFMILSKENPFIFLYGIIYIVISVWGSFAPGIGTWAHIFGLATGLLFGYLYNRKVRAMRAY